MSKLKLAAVFAGVGLIAATRLVGCGDVDDELATLDAILCELDAVCEAGICRVDGEEVETQRILSRAVESLAASRFGDDGLFVLATWEIEERWVELEFDVPTIYAGYVDLDISYAEYINGEQVYRAAEIRGRIELVAPSSGNIPYAGHLELRMESSEGEFRRLHLGYLDPDSNENIRDPGPSTREIDWETAGVELLILRSSDAGTPYSPPTSNRAYSYNFHVSGDPLVDVVIASCAESSEEGCNSDETSDYEGGSDYVEDEGSCSGESEGCSGTDDGSSDESSSDSGCGGESDSEESLCQGDSDDDVWDEDSDKGSCDCSSDTSTEGEASTDTGSACSGDDADTGSGDCSGGETTSGKSSCSGCDADYSSLSRARRHRRDLHARARGLAPRSVRRAFSFLPIAFAFASIRLMRRRRSGD